MVKIVPKNYLEPKSIFWPISFYKNTFLSKKMKVLEHLVEGVSL